MPLFTVTRNIPANRANLRSKSGVIAVLILIASQILGALLFTIFFCTPLDTMLNMRARPLDSMILLKTPSGKSTIAGIAAPPGTTTVCMSSRKCVSECDAQVLFLKPDCHYFGRNLFEAKLLTLKFIFSQFTLALIEAPQYYAICSLNRKTCKLGVHSHAKRCVKRRRLSTLNYRNTAEPLFQCKHGMVHISSSSGWIHAHERTGAILD